MTINWGGGTILLEIIKWSGKIERQRKYKLFSIIALMFAVIGLSIGFAAFQKIMSLSSSATVSLPSEDNLKLTLYGAVDLSEFNSISRMEKLDFTKWSKKKAEAISWNNINALTFDTNYPAIINGEEFVIDIVSLQLKPKSRYSYIFALKNDSEYGVYVYLDEKSLEHFDINNYTWSPSYCTSNDGATQGLMNSVCQEIKMDLAIADTDTSYNDKNGKFLSGNYYLASGEYVVLGFSLDFNGNSIADATVFADFEQIKIAFDTLPHIYENINLVTEEDV